MNKYFESKNLLARFSGEKFARTNWKNIELISIHIPKTAGTSFLHTLKNQYGKNKVVRIDVGLKNKPDPDQNVRVNKIVNHKAYVYKNPKVIHGHFSVDRLKEQIDLAPDLPIITWLRDPVERVISNYFYLSKRLDDELNDRQKKMRLFTRMKKSLIEFVQDENNQNRISKFLKGMPIEDLFFVGLVENYNEDVRVLGEKLNWSNIEVFDHNQTGKKNKNQVEDSVRELIISCNLEDYEIYNRALKIRGKE